MSRHLTMALWVQDGNGGTVQVKAGQTAEELGELAAKITNPHVWSEPAPEPDAEDQGAGGDGSDLDPPPPPAPPAEPEAPATPDLDPAAMAAAGTVAATETEPVADPAAEPEEEPEAADDIPAESEVPSGNVDAVLEWVGEDPTRAKVALKVENAKSRPRTTLVAELEDVASDA